MRWCWWSGGSASRASSNWPAERLRWSRVTEICADCWCAGTVSRARALAYSFGLSCCGGVTMRVIFMSGVLLGLSGLSAVRPVAAQDKPDLLVQASNEGWLALVDAAKYDESWDAASAPVKA